MPFGKKKGAKPKAGTLPPAASKPPAAQRVSSLSAQGQSEPEIIRSLRAEGYSPMEVDSAMKQALRTAVDEPGRRAAPQEPQMEELDMPGLEAKPVPPNDAERRRIFPEEAAQPPYDPMAGMGNDDMPELPTLGELGRQPSPPPRGREPLDDDDDLDMPGLDDEIRPVPRPRPKPTEARAERRRELEELAETIIDERAEAFRREVDGVTDEVKKLESKVHLLEERFRVLDEKKNSEVIGMRKAMMNYNNSVGELSSRMQAMERAIKDSLTPMMQTMRSLSDAVRDMKAK